MQKLSKLLLMISLLLALSSCKPQTSEAEPEPSPLVGEYKLVELVDAAGEDSSTLIDHVREQGYEVSLSLNEDGTGTMVMFTSAHDLTWTDTEIVINGDTMNLAYDQGTLTISGKDGPGKMVFQALN